MTNVEAPPMNWPGRLSLVLLASCTPDQAIPAVDALAPSRFDANGDVDAMSVAPSIEGFYSGLWSASSSVADEKPSLMAAELRLEGNAVTGTVASFETVIGVPEVFTVTGATTGGAFNANLTYPTPFCNGAMQGASRSMSGTVSASDISFSFTDHNCDILYANGIGTARRAMNIPGRVPPGSGGFYTGSLFNYPSESTGGMTIALDLTDQGGTITGTVHTYNIESGREVFLSGSGTMGGARMTLDFTAPGACPTTLHITLTPASGTFFDVAMSGLDCDRIYSGITGSVRRR